MEICSGGAHMHDEIVYEERTCPLCEALERIEELEQTLRKISDNEVS